MDPKDTACSADTATPKAQQARITIHRHEDGKVARPFKRPLLILPVLAVIAGCIEVGPEVSLVHEYAWAGSDGAEPPHSHSASGARGGIAADSTDSVTYAVFTEIDASGRADGILTVMNDSARWRYDPYRGLFNGFMTRDSADAPFHMLAELTREHDGAACRMQGPVDSLGWWTPALTCGGAVVDSVRLLPTRHGFITGQVTSHSAEGPDEGVRVSYCPYDDDGFTLGSCKAAGYTGDGGTLPAAGSSRRMVRHLFDLGSHLRRVEILQDGFGLGGISGQLRHRPAGASQRRFQALPLVQLRATLAASLFCEGIRRRSDTSLDLRPRFDRLGELRGTMRQNLRAFRRLGRMGTEWEAVYERLGGRDGGSSNRLPSRILRSCRNGIGTGRDSVTSRPKRFPR